MGEPCFDVVQGVGGLLWSVVFVIFLVIIIEVDEVCVVIIVALSLGAVTSKMPLLSTLEACVVSQVMWRSLSISNISSGHVSSSSAPPVVWGVGSIDIH